MKLEDIKVGMKVELLSWYEDDISELYKHCGEDEEIQKIKKQGYGIVVDVDKNDIFINYKLDNKKSWCFLPSDLEQYDKDK